MVSKIQLWRFEADHAKSRPRRMPEMIKLYSHHAYHNLLCYAFLLTLIKRVDIETANFNYIRSSFVIGVSRITGNYVSYRSLSGRTIESLKELKTVSQSHKRISQ